MNETILQEYADVKRKIKELEKQEKDLKPLVMDEVSKSGEKTVKKEYGSFTLASRKSWEYSDIVAQKDEELKILKVNEQENGTAKAKESAYLTFK